MKRHSRKVSNYSLWHLCYLEKDYVLWTDASEKGFGAVLEQENADGKRHLTAYASRVTNTAEQKYAPTELETAVSVCIGTFSSLLTGSKVTVFTDHQALVSAYISSSWLMLQP